MSRDRRRSPRPLAQGGLYVQIAGIDARFDVLDVSFGGLRVSGPVWFDRDLEHHLDVCGLVGESHVRLPAKVVYSRVHAEGASGRYETGFAFTDLRQPETARGVQALMDSVTSVFCVL